MTTITRDTVAGAPPVATAVAAGPRRPKQGGGRIGRPGFVWALPAAIFFGLFAIVPLIGVAVLSFTSWSGLADPVFIGGDNWSRLVADPVMAKSLVLSGVLVVLGVVTQTPLSIALGVWAAGPQRNRAVLSAIFFVPLLLSSAAISVLWRSLLDPNFGLPGALPWLFGDGNLLGSQVGAIAVLTFVGIWQFTPFHALIYQGAAKAIPEVLYQAAELDGAGRIRSFFSITLPQLRNSIITSVILMVVGGLTTFDTVLILTNGGPGLDTTITPFYMFRQAFRQYDYGYASAIALVLVVVSTGISLIMVRLSGYDKMRSTMEGI